MKYAAHRTRLVGHLLKRLLPICAFIAISLLALPMIQRRSATLSKLPRQARGSWRQRLNRPISALPIDIFRILVGLLSFWFFWKLRSEAEDYSAPNGLIDHRLSRRIFWYTKLTPLFPGLPLSFFQGLYRMAMGLALLIVTGFWPRLCAALLFIIAVIAYRWHFMVMNVEDGIMHLVLFWTALMPIGRTLTLPGWWRHGQNAFTFWQQQLVPGAVVRTFLGNIALVYLAAGLWKWTSLLWRSGLALFAALKAPVSRTPAFWQRRHLFLLVPGNYFALIIEPLLALMIFLPTGHWLKLGLAVCAAALHIGITLTMYIPFANVALEAALTLVLREELASLLGASPAPESTPDQDKLDRPGRIGISLLAILIGAMVWETRHPEWRPQAFRRDGILYRFAERIRLNPRAGHHQNPMYAILWVLGFAQSYRLFDWIDERNYYVNYTAIERRHDGTVQSINPDEILPVGLRGALIKSYLHGLPWMKVKPDDLAAIRQALFERIASRYSRRHPHAGQITVYAHVQRTTAENLDLNQAQRQILLSFMADQGRVQLFEIAALPEIPFG